MVALVVGTMAASVIRIHRHQVEELALATLTGVEAGVVDVVGAQVSTQACREQQLRPDPICVDEIVLEPLLLLLGKQKHF